MNHKTKIGLGAAAGVLVLPGGAIGVASAVGGDGDEVSGGTTDQARAAAVQAAPGGKTGSVEAGTNEGTAAYGGTATKPDGSVVEAHLDKGFHVLGPQARSGPRRRGRLTPPPSDRHYPRRAIDMSFITAGAARRAVVPLAALLLVALAACGTPTSAANPGVDTDNDAAHGHHQPIPTTEADWKPVTDTLGRTGKFGDNNTVYRISLPRTDLHVTSGGVAIKPGLSLGGYAAFAKYRDGVMLMGDLVVTQDELPKVTDALQGNGIEQTALHKHLLEQTPPIWWTHIHAMSGNPTALAQGVKAALDATAIPPAAAPPGQQPPIDLDTAGIDQALGRKGTADNGIYKFTIARKETIVDDGHVLPPMFGVTTGINFQPVGGGRAAINGDFVMAAPEVQKVIQALRKGAIELVEVHNHSVTEQPRLFYAHFWAVDDGVTLAKALRPALDATNLQPAN